jgi:cytochrome c-type biogenesis protein CcsB|uniref:Cytochrome c biogenesis protein CcsA n=1 Tax=Dunaliella salina TaxID=3046 RepID=D0FXZ1_DUNSA|nr:cytochrome c biogenesis protein [Dunaliella salina]ACS95077.1 cytochrome c biogenesis protein [Dunaliella salina]
MNAQLANLSFLVLLCSMICYWIGPLSRDLFGNYSSKPSTVISTGLNQSVIPSELVVDGLGTKSSNNSSLFSTETNVSTLQTNAGFLGGVLNNIRSQIGYIKLSFNISNSLQLIGRSGIILSNVLLMVLLCNRWKESGHFPLSNLYESLMFLSWSFTVIHLFLENLTNSQTASNQSVGKFIGAITTPSALFTNAFATFTLPKEMQGSSSLVPALQSNWLMMHVTVMIISYAALILGSLLSIAYLIITIKRESNFDTNLDSNNITNKDTEETNSEFVSTKGTLDNSNKKNLRQSIALTLDNLSYRILGIGFPFLTIGILSGAVWANEAWGSYWSWDPKETWAFLTWLVYAIYLHTRLNKGWEGKKPAIIASLGFIVTWICYLGVNLIGEGLHSYGWIIK